MRNMKLDMFYMYHIILWCFFNIFACLSRGIRLHAAGKVVGGEARGEYSNIICFH